MGVWNETREGMKQGSFASPATVIENHMGANNYSPEGEGQCCEREEIERDKQRERHVCIYIYIWT